MHISGESHTVNEQAYPCRMQACYGISKATANTSKHKIPPHRKKCLIQRVLSNGKAITIYEILDALCQEFPYFDECRELNESKFKKKFQDAICRYKQIFKFDQSSRTYSITPSSTKAVKGKIFFSLSSLTTKYIF